MSSVMMGPAMVNYALVPGSPGRAEPAPGPRGHPLLEEWDGPLLVTGGPGSGKTTLVVEAAVRVTLADTEPPPLVLTWSRAAAGDLRNRVSLSLGQGASAPAVSTVHALCRSLVDRFGDREGWRLLNAPEQEFRVRELLAGQQCGAWPPGLEKAVRTRQFAGQVRAVLARARQLGLDPEDLERFGAEADLAEWMAVGRFFRLYLDVLDHENALDYAELVHRARILVTDAAVVSRLRREIGSVIVDEYGECDPAQIGLVRSLVGEGGRILATGDPDQTVNSFRGAHPRALGEFPVLFAQADGSPAPVHHLGPSHRLPRPVAQAVAGIRSRLPQQPPASVRPHGSMPAGGPTHPVAGQDPASVRVFTAAGEAAQARHIADVLRRAHLLEHIGYGDMAVLVRSGRRQLGPIARALVSAGIPVEVAGDELPLAESQAARPLLLALEVVARGHAGPDEAMRLITSPLGGLDAVGLRSLVRQWRVAQRGGAPACDPVPSTGEVIAEALNHPEWLENASVTTHTTSLARLARVLKGAREGLDAGESVDQVLWRLWAPTPWPERLRGESARGGDQGRRADRDLDALCALFDVAAEADRRGGEAGVWMFLAEMSAQQIPADHEREARLRGRGVRVMTVHRAKGRQWQVVVVAGVQEGLWPSRRRAPGILEPERLLTSGLVGRVDPREILAQERRLFYLACTRAERHLVVTAAAGTDGEADQPSRFLVELGVPVQPVPPAGPPLTIPGLVADLRRAAADPAHSDALRDWACVALARLAERRDDQGRPLAPQADPATWWGVRDLSSRAVPARGPIRLSPSQVGALLTCPRRYFLQRPVQAEGVQGPSASLGAVIHTLVQFARTDNLALADLSGHLDRVWDRLPFEAAWMSAGERVEAELALSRFLAWQEGAGHEEVLGVEIPFAVDLQVNGQDVTIAGAVDRLERTASGGLRVVDFKTARRIPTRSEIAGMEQLGVYQLAIEEGAFEQVAPGERRSAGARVVYLRHSDPADDLPRQFDQPGLSDRPHLSTEPAEVSFPTWVHHRVATAAGIVARGRFEAQAGGHCRSCPFATSCPASSRGGQVGR